MESPRSIVLPGYVIAITNESDHFSPKASFPPALTRDAELVRTLRNIKEAKMIASGQLVMPPLDTLKSIVSPHNEGSAPDIDADLSMRNRKLGAIIKDMEEYPDAWSVLKS